MRETLGQNVLGFCIDAWMWCRLASRLPIRQRCHILHQTIAARCCCLTLGQRHLAVVLARTHQHFKSVDATISGSAKNTSRLPSAACLLTLAARKTAAEQACSVPLGTSSREGMLIYHMHGVGDIDLPGSRS